MDRASIIASIKTAFRQQFIEGVQSGLGPEMLDGIVKAFCPQAKDEVELVEKVKQLMPMMQDLLLEVYDEEAIALISGPVLEGYTDEELNQVAALVLNPMMSRFQQDMARAQFTTPIMMERIGVMQTKLIERVEALLKDEEPVDPALSQSADRLFDSADVLLKAE